MNSEESAKIFAALAQETRLDVFRLLIKAGEKGLSSGEVADSLNIRQNTMSTNLSILHNAKLVRRKREGRMIRYFVNMETIGVLLTFLLEHCCGGESDMVSELVTSLQKGFNQSN
ncbi:ArsR family transcriptional regulator [Enterovibrio norvegicus FF-33]|uniref:ArsR family transcriptional regulator n=1 Tax=Enterovibrio norvegicus FF-454 TaxID=1185651 RepID=A0A1E5BWT7_9GAMM|nr:metalloregulator ArsR/SmtB family transcription factor [Enterovibrio norvegicus]OEE57728.1 ArsR family transcriptional regulator [Enterovibrio norvegicus FF-454]OEE67497.1 ArsR family transcriptional regulator [Enterovibrio norvegicus FF-33]OEE81760.1 ArsR family transcriptional regulator [Enterovibrio norvegicus FF-162]